jgi:type 1 glutamine amidotransferase
MLPAALLVVFVLALPLFGQDNKPIQVLIITGDHGHKWQETTPFIKDLLTKAGMKVDVTETPSKDLTADNLAKYDVLFLNYRDTKNGKPESRWSDANKRAFADAVRGGKGLVAYHHTSSAFVSGSDLDNEFERVIAGGWRKQGNHGKRHVFNVTIRRVDHLITHGMPVEFKHSNDELYQNSVMLPESVVLCTAYSDKKLDPKNTGKEEPIVWVATYGKGRVYHNVLGHDVDAMQSPGFQALLIRGTEWAATGEVRHKIPEGLR